MEPTPVLTRTAGALRLTLHDRGVHPMPDLGPGQSRHLFTLRIVDTAVAAREPIEQPALFPVDRPRWTSHEAFASMVSLMQHTGEAFALAEIDPTWVTDELSVLSGWVPQACAENHTPLEALARESEASVALLRQARYAVHRTEPAPPSAPDAPTL